MTRWMGRWIIFVSLLHTIFGMVMFWPVIAQIALAGVFNAVGTDPMRGAVAWFLLAGFFMATIGLAVDALERTGQHQALRNAGITMLLTALLGIVLFPASGFWLTLPSSIAMIVRKRESA